MVERYVRDVEAAGSSPVASTNKKEKHFACFSFLFIAEQELEPVKVCQACAPIVLRLGL